MKKTRKTVSIWFSFFRGSAEGTWKWERQEALGSCKLFNEAQLAQFKKAPVCWVGGPSSNLGEILVISCWLCLRPRLTFPTFLYKTWQNVHTRNKTLAPIDRWPAWLGHPFSMLGHPLNQANVSAAHKHLIWLAHPGKLGQRQKIKACANAVLKSWLGLLGQFFLITVLAKVDAAERVPFFPGTTFLYLNGA